jgi:hypothetical protein
MILDTNVNGPRKVSAGTDKDLGSGHRWACLS